MSLKPPDDWDFTIRDVRLTVDEAQLPAAGRVEAVRRMLYEGTVTVEWYEGGAWSQLFIWPAYMLPCGGLRLQPSGEVAPAPDWRIRGTIVDAPQRVRAARTRVTFPDGAYLMVDGTDRGSEVVFPVWSKRSPFVLSTARGVPSEARS